MQQEQIAPTSSNNSGIKHDVARQHRPAVERHGGVGAAEILLSPNSSEYMLVDVGSKDEVYYENEDVVCS
ncbi:unnamed protein product [Urochloa humidicola]